MNKNIYKIYAFSFFYMFILILPVIVPFFLNLGLSMEQFFWLQSIYGISVVVFEIPTGYICDLWGRKNSLLIGSFLTGSGFTYLVYVNSFNELILYEFIIALGLSFISGADVSLLYDSLKSNERKNSIKAIANLEFYALSGESLAAILGGLLVVFSFQYLVVINAFFCWIPFVIAITLREPSYKKMERESHWKNFQLVLKHIFKNEDKLLLSIFINWVVWGLSTFFAVWMYQKYWEENSVPITYFGFMWSFINILSGVVGKLVHPLENRFGALFLIFILGVTPILGYFGMGVLGGIVGVAMGSLLSISRGITQVLFSDAINLRTPSQFRATVNSIQSLFFRLGFAIVGPAVGLSIDKFGMRFTLNFLGALFTLLFFLILIPLIVKIKKYSFHYTHVE